MIDAVARLGRVDPIVTRLVAARDIGVEGRTLAHAGPPFDDAETIPAPVLNALAGACVLEGWAADPEAGLALLRAGRVRLVSNHALCIVSPMAGVVRPSQPLFEVRDRAAAGAAAYATLAEKGRRTLRFGCFDDGVAAALAHLETTIAPAIEAVLPEGGLPVLPLVAEAVALGDDVHQRNVAGLLGLLRALPDLDGATRRFLGDHPQFFLNVAMAAAKLTLDSIRGLPGCALVTAIARNGAVCGIQLAGTGPTWFTAPCQAPRGRIFAPYIDADAQNDLGDSAIMEAYGLGGCIAHLALELAPALGVDPETARAAGLAQRDLFAARHDRMSSVASGAVGVGFGLDARRALASPVPVRIHTGIAHRDGRSGWIGIGVADVPRACFEQGVKALAAMTSSGNGTHAAV